MPFASCLTPQESWSVGLSRIARLAAVVVRRFAQPKSIQKSMTNLMKWLASSSCKKLRKRCQSANLKLAGQPCPKYGRRRTEAMLLVCSGRHLNCSI